MREIKYIVIHHSKSSLKTTAEDIDKWHRARGWAGIGYHFVIEGTGKIVRGREISRIGAHVKGKNTNSIGICVVGDNVIVRRKWRASQIASLTKLVDILKVMFPKAVIEGHRDMVYTNTVCPGLFTKELLK